MSNFYTEGPEIYQNNYGVFQVNKFWKVNCNNMMKTLNSNHIQTTLNLFWQN